MQFPLFVFILFSFSNAIVETEEDGEDETPLFEGRRLSWEEEDGLKIEIIHPISKEECKLKSRPGDVVEQFYHLSDEDGNELGSNFGKETYRFTLGKKQVIPGMDRAMTGVCVGEKRRVTIPPKLGFKEKDREAYKLGKDQVLYYVVELKDLFRPNPGKTWTTDEGIKISVTHQIEKSECRFSKPGDTIHQHYKLWLEDGSLVDSSYTNDQPFVFKLGAKEVIKGIDIGMNEMCEGEHRQLTIPSEYGYGKEGSPPKIPSDATLYFTVVLSKLIKRDEL